MSKLIIPIRRTTVKTKEEIVEELKNYKKVLSGEVYSYLTNLINLNNSALEEKFSNDEISLIRNMPMFDDITLYNLYYLTKEYSINHPEINLDKQINNIKLYNSEANTQNVLFDLYFNQTHDTKNKEINFYNQINDQKYYKLLDKQINEELKYEYNQENPYEIVLGRYGGPASNW